MNTLNQKIAAVQFFELLRGVTSCQAPVGVCNDRIMLPGSSSPGCRCRWPCPADTRTPPGCRCPPCRCTPRPPSPPASGSLSRWRRGRSSSGSSWRSLSAIMTPRVTDDHSSFYHHHWYHCDCLLVTTLTNAQDFSLFTPVAAPAVCCALRCPLSVPVLATLSPGRVCPCVPSSPPSPAWAASQAGIVTLGLSWRGSLWPGNDGFRKSEMNSAYNIYTAMILLTLWHDRRCFLTGFVQMYSAKYHAIQPVYERGSISYWSVSNYRVDGGSPLL